MGACHCRRTLSSFVVNQPVSFMQKTPFFWRWPSKVIRKSFRCIAAEFETHTKERKTKKKRTHFLWVSPRKFNEGLKSWFLKLLLLYQSLLWLESIKNTKYEACFFFSFFFFCSKQTWFGFHELKLRGETLILHFHPPSVSRDIIKDNKCVLLFFFQRYEWILLK